MDNNSKHKPSKLPLFTNIIFYIFLIMVLAINTHSFYIRLAFYVAFMIAGLIAFCLYVFEIVKCKKEPYNGKYAMMYALMGMGVFILIMVFNIFNVSKLW